MLLGSSWQLLPGSCRSQRLALMPGMQICLVNKLLPTVEAIAMLQATLKYAHQKASEEAQAAKNACRNAEIAREVC